MRRRGKTLIEAPEPERLDLVVRGGRVVTPDGVHDAELGILRGKIVKIAPEIADDTHVTLEAEGQQLPCNCCDNYELNWSTSQIKSTIS